MLRHLESNSNMWEFEKNTSPNSIQCYFLHRNVGNTTRLALFDMQQRTIGECLLQSPSGSPVASPRIRSPFLRSSSISPSSLGSCPFSAVISRKSVEDINSKDCNISKCEENRKPLKNCPVNSSNKRCTPKDPIKVD